MMPRLNSFPNLFGLSNEYHLFLNSFWIVVKIAQMFFWKLVVWNQLLTTFEVLGDFKPCTKGRWVKIGKLNWCDLWMTLSFCFYSFVEWCIAVLFCDYFFASNLYVLIPCCSLCYFWNPLIYSTVCQIATKSHIKI